MKMQFTVSGVKGTKSLRCVCTLKKVVIFLKSRIQFYFHLLSPILEEIASDADFKITIAKVNIDENPRTPTNYGVRSIPTLMLFSNGELKDTKVGALPRQELKEWIKSNS